MYISDINPGQTLLDLQRAAYAVEAEIIGDDRIPPLRESLDDLLAQRLLWRGAVDDDGTLIGAVAWSDTGHEIDIDRLVVDPRAHRRGVGRALVAELLDRAGGKRVIVATGRDNLPARTLYEKLGFTTVEDVEVIPGLWISRYVLGFSPP
ncbi:GNAT family N-acetyltransferase [Nonomuraea africana]|uniref:GNAT superfamily N-acetyltransferase n=1 Tax=Nonomuraea africana TaxID=46171 RepID=A0ABR9KM42_9ACTN|nr:GNAT family N-acetyltransferase [Nonomuraea africana]MBE1563075.1 GNAT superfamily N-acetyltransferase [Nonomuraea africana]